MQRDFSRMTAAEAKAYHQSISSEALALSKKDDLTERDIARIEELRVEVERLRDYDFPVEDPVEGSSAVRTQSKEWEERSYAAVCRASNTPIETGEWRDSAEFLSAALFAHQQHDPRLKRSGGQSSVEGSLGGFVIPDAMAGQMFDLAQERELIRPRATFYPMSGPTLKIPAWANSDHTSGNLYGGLNASWAGEGEELDVKTARVRSVELVAQKCGFIGKIPSELTEDSGLFAREFQRVLTRSISWHLDDAFLSGDGVGKPLGLLNSANTALVTVSKKTGQAADTILYENCVAMFSRLLPESRSRAVWVASSSTLPQLLTLNLAIGTSGVFIPAVREANGGFTLMGLPLLLTEKAPALGEKGDLSLFDLSFYAVGMRAGTSILFSPHVYLTSDEIAARVRARIAGVPLVSEPFTPKGGGPTQSPFITLEARA